MFIEPELALKHIHIVSTTRNGGVSTGRYKSFNLGMHVDDDLVEVKQNRGILQAKIGVENAIVWLNQVHGNDCVLIDANNAQECHTADASITSQRQTPLAIMTADCLPVILANPKINQVAAIHCGWRSTAQGLLEKTVDKMAGDSRDIVAWLGPCIGSKAFEVGRDVVDSFVAANKLHQSAFLSKHGNKEKYLCDLQLIVKQKLSALKVNRIVCEQACTFTEDKHFFSYRRDGQTGRMATLVWID